MSNVLRHDAIRGVVRPGEGYPKTIDRIRKKTLNVQQADFAAIGNAIAGVIDAHSADADLSVYIEAAQPPLTAEEATIVLDGIYDTLLSLENSRAQNFLQIERGATV